MFTWRQRKNITWPCVTGTPEELDSFSEKVTQKLSKNVWQSTQHNCETVTQKKVLKLSVDLESIEKH